MDCFWNWVDLIKEGLAVREIERRAGVKHGLVSNAYGDHSRTITLPIIEAIADGLDLNRSEVYQKYLECIEYHPPNGNKLLRLDKVVDKIWEYLEHPPVVAEKSQPYYTGKEAKLVGLYDRLRPERQTQLLQFAYFLTITEKYDLSGQMAELMAGVTSGDLDRLFDQMVTSLKKHNSSGDEEDKT